MAAIVFMGGITDVTIKGDKETPDIGGVHGGNRLGGNAVADIVVCGRIASASAVEWCNNQ